MNCDKCGKSICWVERDDNNGLCDECAEEKEQVKGDSLERASKGKTN